METKTADNAAPLPVPETIADQKAYLDSLVEKHAKEIYGQARQNRSAEQQKQFWRDNGIDPEKLAASYPELFEKSELLRKDNIIRTRKARNFGEIVALGTLTTALMLPTDKVYNNNPFVKAVFSAFAAIGAGALSHWGATWKLTHRNRKESSQVSTQSRDVLIYNLALLYEMKERGMLGEPVAKDSGAGANAADAAHDELSALEAGTRAAKQSYAAAKASVKSRKPGYAEQLKAEEAAQAVINKSIS